MKRAFLLLEVAVAVGILAVGMAFVGMQIQNAARTSREAERSMRALLLAESKLTEFEMGSITPDTTDEKRGIPFGKVFPDYGWRLEMQPSATPELNIVILDILYQPRPDVKQDLNYETAQLVHRLYTLRATPRALDLTQDFGMDEEQADKLTEQLAAVGDAGLDPRNLDPRLFANLNLEQLLQVAPPLLEALGMKMEDLMQLLPADLQQALKDAQAQFEENAGGDTGDTGGTGSTGGGAGSAGGPATGGSGTTAGGSGTPDSGQTGGSGASGTPASGGQATPPASGGGTARPSKSGTKKP
jgi:hypothetical protein